MRRLKEITFGVTGLMGILVLLELFIRGGGIVPPSFTDYEEGIGRVRRKNLEYVMFSEGFTIGSFNQGRYLGPYYPPRSNGVSNRIALLGDSYVEGFQVFDRHHFRRVMEKELAHHSEKTVEVLNFGRSGFDLEDMVTYYHTYVNKYLPDVTLLLLFEEDFHPAVSDPLVPRLEFENGRPGVTFSASKSYREQYLKYKDVPYYSAYFNMALNCWKQHRRGLTGSKLLGKFYGMSNKTKKGTRTKGSRPSPGMVSEYDLEKTQQLLTYLNDITSLVIVKCDSARLSEELEVILRDNSIKIIDLNAKIRQLEERDFDPNYWEVTNQTGHWNHAAHAAIGRHLAEELEVVF